MTHCDDCGTKLDRGGICPNCDEELFIATFQEADPMSQEFSDLVDEQSIRARNRTSGESRQ